MNSHAEYLKALKRAREIQAKQVMPLIGPLLDAWDGVSNDTKSFLQEECPTLCRYLNKIEDGMCADIGAGS